jgi:hypothetical protein
MEMGIVFMVDMFSLENRYCLTSQIHKYVGEADPYYLNQLHSICDEVALKRTKSMEEEEEVEVTPTVILYLYFQISRKDSLKRIIDSNLELFKHINPLKWIRISQILGIIERVHEKFAFDEDTEGSHEFEFISEENLRLYLA